MVTAVFQLAAFTGRHEESLVFPAKNEDIIVKSDVALLNTK